MYHPHAFTTLQDAFEPRSNAAYAARFLNTLFAGAQDWSHAIAAYHSETPALGEAYRALVMARWQSPDLRSAPQGQQVVQQGAQQQVAYGAFAQAGTVYGAFRPADQTYGAFAARPNTKLQPDREGWFRPGPAKAAATIAASKPLPRSPQEMVIAAGTHANRHEN